MAVSQARARGRKSGRSEGPAFLDDILAMAGSLAGSRKDFAAAQIEDLADTVRQFSDAIPSLPNVKSYAETAASSLEQLAAYVMESDLPEIIADAREIARRHPLATFGGSVAAGLVITQLVQSRTGTLRSTMRTGRQRTSPRHRGRTAARVQDDDAAA